MFSAALLGLTTARQVEGASNDGEILVLAAASMRDVLARLAADFEVAHPESKVRMSLAGSQELRTQLERGARAELFVAADVITMRRLERQNLVEAFVIVARNRPVLIVSRARSAPAIRSFTDLPKARRLVVGVPACPIGAYTLEILRAAEQRLGRSFRDAVEARIVSRELNVRHVLTKVALGEADAGIVYASDVVSASDKVRSVEIPADLNVIAEYPAAVIKNAADPVRARDFLDLLRSPQGQKRFEEAGFLRASDGGGT